MLKELFFSNSQIVISDNIIFNTNLAYSLQIHFLYCLLQYFL